jgi:hypothetical protein
VSSTPSYEIQGRKVAMPVEVRRASNASALYLVPADALRALLPDDAFEPIEAAPGQTQLILSLIDYVDNDLGDYNEIGVIFFVRPRGSGPESAGSYIHRLPVDQSFTCEAGCRIWGFPKSVERIDYEYGEDGVSGRLEMDGRHAFTLTLPRSGTPEDTDATHGYTYTYIEGVPHRTPMATGGGAVVNPPGAACRLELGDHALAGTLRSLGLPKPPLATTWTPHLFGSFGVPEKL